MNCIRTFAVALCLVLSACVDAPSKKATPAATSAAPAPTVIPIQPPPLAYPVPPPVVATAPEIDATPPDLSAAPVAKPAVAAKRVAPAQAPAIAAGPKKAPPALPSPQPAPPAAAASSAQAAAGTGLGGRLEVVAGPGQTVEASEVADAVVYFVPDGGAAHPKPGQLQIYTRDKQFDPTSTVVTLGSTVSFPNKDEVLHNVFSASPGAEFDLGLYGEGKSAAYTFARSGVVIVHCNVHPLMQVSVLVVDTPFFTHPSRSGEFQLSGLLAVPGKLVIWHPRAGIQTFPLQSSATSGLALQIVLAKPRIAPHLNKERKPYQTSGPVQ